MVLVILCQNVSTRIFFLNQAEKGSNSIKDEKLKKNFDNRVLILALVYVNAVRLFAILPPGGDKCVVPGQADNSEPFLT